MSDRLQIFLDRFTEPGTCQFSVFLQAFAAVEQFVPDTMRRIAIEKTLKARGLLNRKTVAVALKMADLQPFMRTTWTES